VPVAAIGSELGCTRQHYAPAVYEVTDERFEQFVAEAIDSIPDNVAKAMDNVAFLVEDDAPDHEALGTYDGIPIPDRLGSTYPFAPAVERPDRVILYKRSIERACGSESGVRDQVCRTLYDNVARLFGVGAEEFDKLTWNEA
jgi:predicted Zn-dependent protease with MMP-like domain